MKVPGTVQGEVNPTEMTHLPMEHELLIKDLSNIVVPKPGSAGHTPHQCFYGGKWKPSRCPQSVIQSALGTVVHHADVVLVLLRVFDSWPVST